MKQTVLIIGSIYGMMAVILGALGAHAFKKILSEDKLQSFDTGVKYQMYHALVLLIIGIYFQFNSGLEKSMAWSFILGTLFFSLSIYLLVFSEYWGINLKFLGPITPLGGLGMIAGWALLIYIFIKQY